MEDRSRLPSLPGSDVNNLRKDTYDHFYKKRPSEIWQGKIDRTEVKEPNQCEHFFEKNDTGVECKKCHMGLIGEELTVIDGHVYFQKQKLL